MWRTDTSELDFPRARHFTAHIHPGAIFPLEDDDQKVYAQELFKAAFQGIMSSKEWVGKRIVVS